MSVENGTEVYAQVGAAAPRRWFGYAVLFGLGALLIYLSFVSLGGWVSRLVLFALGLLCIFAADHFQAQCLSQMF